MTAPRPHHLKVMQTREKPGRPVVPGDPLPLCGRPQGHSPPCRSEEALRRVAAQKKKDKRTGRRRRKNRALAA